MHEMKVKKKIVRIDRRSARFTARVRAKARRVRLPSLLEAAEKAWKKSMHGPDASLPPALIPLKDPEIVDALLEAEAIRLLVWQHRLRLEVLEAMLDSASEKVRTLVRVVEYAAELPSIRGTEELCQGQDGVVDIEELRRLFAGRADDGDEGDDDIPF